MGSRGPVGLPPNVHAMRGTTPRADRDGPSTPVRLRPGAPAPPDWLDDEAAAEWQRVVPMLDGQGLVSAVDRAILVSYAVSWSVLCRAVAELGQVETFKTEGSKGPIRTPELMAWRDAVNTLAMLASKVMATPVDRLRVRLPAPAELDPGGILD